MPSYDPDLWPASWILGLISQGNIHGFYTSSHWKKLRREVLKDQKRRCWDCAHKSPAVNRRGVHVHHLHPVRERPDLALSKCDEQGHVNLVCLCGECHYRRHHQIRELSIPERW